MYVSRYFPYRVAVVAPILEIPRPTKFEESLAKATHRHPDNHCVYEVEDGSHSKLYLWFEDGSLIIGPTVEVRESPHSIVEFNPPIYVSGSIT